MASIRRRKRAKQDVWHVDYRDATGVRRRLTAVTKAEAEDLLAEKIRERQIPGPPSSDRDITVAEYRQRWLVIVASGGFTSSQLSGIVGFVSCTGE